MAAILFKENEIINENTFQEGKILTGQYYMKNILPKTNYLAKKILSGDKIIMSLNSEQFWAISNYFIKEKNLEEAFIYDSVRSPRGKGKSDGSLHELTSVYLSSEILKAIRDRNNLDCLLYTSDAADE